MRVIKGILIDTINGNVRVVTLSKSWNKYYETIGSTKVELLVKRVGGKNFAIMVEEYDKTKFNQIVSGISTDFEEHLYGNLLVFALDETDELASLTDKDINLIFDNISSYDTDNGLRQRIVYER